MQTSPFLKHLPIMLKAIMGYDVGSRSFTWLTVTFLTCGIIDLITTIYRFNVHAVPNGIVIIELTKLVILLLFTIHSIAIMSRKEAFGQLVEHLLAPIVACEQNPLKTEASKSWTNWINFNGIFYFVVLEVLFCSLTLILQPLLTLMLLPEKTEVQDLPLPYGWIPFRTDSYFLYTAAYLIGAVECVGSGPFVIWHMVMSFSALKIKLMLKLLTQDVKDFDRIVALRTECQLLERTSLLSHRIICPRDKARIADECRSQLLKEVVDRHIGIIRNVKLMNDCNSIPVLTLIQACSMISALLLPLAMQDQLIWDQIYIIVGGVGSIIMVAVACKSGQMIRDEGETLQLALYSYKWYNQPMSVKRSFLIMILVTSRPLQLMAGGMFPLNFETLSNFLQAVYSYINFLLGIKQNGQ